MRAAIFTSIILSIFCGRGWCQLPPPPVIQNLPVQGQQYFKELYDNHNTIKVITSSPNGVVNGASGQVIIVNTNNVFKIWVNQGGKVWVQI